VREAGTVAAMRLRVASLVVAGALCPAGARAGEGDPAPVDVQRAIDRGAEWLRDRFREGFDDRRFTDPVELVVLTLAHVGSTAKDPLFAKALATAEKAEPRFTYRTALLAMALAEVNPRLHRGKIAHCAQWLVDTQLREGEWGYPGETTGSATRPDGIRVEPPLDASQMQAASASRDRITIRRRATLTSDRVERGDFSNTQFAVLGLRACREAGVDVPPATWKSALEYLRRTQRPDGGWGYVMAGQQDDASYASLTAAGVCSAAICLHATGTKDPKSDALVKRGLDWLRKNPDLASNVGIDASRVVGPSPWQCYHLYSVERAARVLGLDEIGGRPWYGPGARWLLDAQQEDGRWEDPSLGGSRPRYLTPADTCFALLFLSRSTRPLTGR
jgi:hypothetical protein